MFVKPKPDLTVIDPASNTALPAEGKEVHGNQTYWQRRIRELSVEVVPPPKGGKAK